MKEFDYKTAWQEVAAPAFNALPPEVHYLYQEVCQHCGDLRQDADTLDMPFPAGLREKFEKLTDMQLADSAAIIHAFGHWHSSNPDNTGAYWKYSNYADQVLTARLGLRRRPRYGPYAAKGLEVHEGVIRVCLSAKWFWQWEEVCLATRENLEAIRAANLPGPPQGPAPRQFAEDWADTCLAQIKTLKNNLGPKDGYATRLFNLEEFMVERPERSYV